MTFKTLIVIGVMAASAPASADVLFNSLDSPNTGVVAFNFQVLDSSFQTGGAAVRLTDVALSLSAFSQPGGAFAVSLEGGIPLSSLEFISGTGLTLGPVTLPIPSVIDSVTLPISDLSSALTVQHFSQFDGIALKANSFYWIDVSAAAFAGIGWGVTTDDSGPGVSLGYNASQITDDGFFPNAPAPPPNNGGPVFMMEVSASAVPEPATWVMMLVGFAGLGLVAKRRGTALASTRA